MSTGPLFYHSSGINDKIAFSPDGNWLATGNDLWDMRDPSAEPIFLGLSISVQECNMKTLAFSPDGNWLAGSDDNNACLWDVRDPSSATPPLVLRGHQDNITTLAFSPDSNWLATGSDDNTARLWNISDPYTYLVDPPKPIVLKGHESFIATLAFSPDGKWLATGSWDSTARLWNMPNTSVEPIVLRGNENIDYPVSIYALAFSPDGNWLATGSDTARLWDMRNPSTQPIVLQHDGIIDTLAFSPDGNWLAAGSGNIFTDTMLKIGTASLWDMRNPSAEPIVLKGHDDYITILAFSLDGNWLATGSDDATARLWDISDPSAQPIVLKGHEGPITTPCLQPGWKLAGNGERRHYCTPVGQAQSIRTAHCTEGTRKRYRHPCLQPRWKLAGNR
ncbi:MAG: WD40 repeat domain-containing protein [Anaerolineales bacterium]|nr:WD40 repeat domain-containing protein [Anaerolineales bacterium]